MKAEANDIARHLATERMRLERALDQVEKSRARIRQLENGGAVKAKSAGERDIVALMAQTISVSQAAASRGVSIATISRWCARYDIGVQLGPSKRWRIFPDRLRKHP
jgi:hypothetical protein